MNGLTSDADLVAVAAFMQRNLPAAKLVSVANALAAVAPLMWGHYLSEPVVALALERETISACDPHKPPSATEYGPALGCAGGGSAAGTGQAH